MAISLSDVSKRFDTGVVLPPLSLQVDYGDMVAVTGPNGGGKTTLLRIMLGLTAPSSGTVSYFSHGKCVRALAMGYLPQKNSIDARFPMTVDHTVRTGLLSPHPSLRRPLCDAGRKAVDAVAELCGLSELLHKPLGTLSGGQVQRTLLARALVSRPDVVVLDEPLSYLDREYSDRLVEMLALMRRKVTLIIVSHQMELIAPLCDRVLYVDRSLSESKP